uniref:S10_plectin domain-containing protein n=1 Tax=Heterorhabditis bacteriophora TaxID=37862 RepID=A0A1I7W6F7_HETBA
MKVATHENLYKNCCQLVVRMLIPNKHRRAIYEYLFHEGVAVAKKDYNLKQHPNIEGVSNLEVIKTLKELPLFIVLVLEEIIGVVFVLNKLLRIAFGTIHWVTTFSIGKGFFFIGVDNYKFHLINPYFLSCVGLLLGWRVTKCFWKTITELVATLAANRPSFVQSALTIFEYAIVKTPLMTLIVTSFLFSFSRICNDFPSNAVMYFFHPLVIYVLVFYSELLGRLRRMRCAFSEWLAGTTEVTQVFDRLIEPPPAQLDLDSVLHMCSSNPVQIREEVSLLLEDLFLRLKRSLFAGVCTAFLSIFLPCVFVPYKTTLGLPQKVLVDEAWEAELCIVVALTAFSLYITYLLPLNYLDLLHRSAVHLGTWDPIDGPKVGQTGQANRPCTLINAMCVFEGALIVVQFWMLVLTTDWQHIVTLVLLLFANYLLLAKLFKDKIIIGRIYDPSPEDLALIQQLQNENKIICFYGTLLYCWNVYFISRSMNMEKNYLLEYSMMAHPVKVELVQGGKGEMSLEGNLYTVDPITGSIILIRFRKDGLFYKPWKMDWIPREAIREISLLEHPTDSCKPHSVELEEYFKGLFGMIPVETMNKEEIDIRCNHILYFFAYSSQRKVIDILIFVF